MVVVVVGTVVVVVARLASMPLCAIASAGTVPPSAAALSATAPQPIRRLPVTARILPCGLAGGIVRWGSAPGCRELLAVGRHPADRADGPHVAPDLSRRE